LVSGYLGFCYLTGTAKTERAARRLVHELVKQVNQGQVLAHPDVTLNDLIAEWMDKAGPPGAATRLDYNGYIKHDIGKTRLRALRVEHLDAWYVRLKASGLAPALIRKAHNMVRGRTDSKNGISRQH